MYRRISGPAFLHSKRKNPPELWIPAGLRVRLGRGEELLSHDTQMPPDARIRWLRIRVVVVAVLATAGRIEHVTDAVYTIHPSRAVMPLILFCDYRIGNG
jgi:hypothetical protein